MPANSETILTESTYDGSTTTITGEKYKGDGYYGRSDGVHTVQWTLTDFIGTVNIQATLAINPTESDWFTVSTNTYTVAESSSNIQSFTGNYVWVRATVNSWSDGTIEKIQLNH